MEVLVVAALNLGAALAPVDVLPWSSNLLGDLQIPKFYSDVNLFEAKPFCSLPIDFQTPEECFQHPPVLLPLAVIRFDLLQTSLFGHSPNAPHHGHYSS
jgi:hypothetical protein